MRLHGFIWILSTGCTCTLGERDVVYGGGSVTLSMVARTGSPPHGTFTTTGFDQGTVDGFSGGWGFVGLGDPDLPPGAALSVEGIGSDDRWIVRAAFPVPEGANPVDACGGTADFVGVQIARHGLSASVSFLSEGGSTASDTAHAVDVGADGDTDVGPVAPAVMVERASQSTLGGGTNDRRPFTGSVHVAGVEWRSEACADPSLGTTDIDVDWTFDPAVRSVTDWCKPASTISFLIF